jgi:ATP-dependent exoDNAse (exonuclease V) beta subunit
MKSNTGFNRDSAAGMKFGREVHQLLEKISWFDEVQPSIPRSRAATWVENLIRNPKLKDLFLRNNRNIELVREQPVDAIVEGNLLTGVIDRLHIHRNSVGDVVRIEVIDFKTDSVAEPALLATRYAGQMTAYRTSLRKVYPDAEIQGFLLSIPHASMVPVN